ncbi:uncharacterized protein LOC113305863 [Papaver somniferum]|uniref:uncharacterized protein LOC113305863 n=1 Tax=Papaver somniferum TaxID=3469 RepID=UPI000E6FE9FF|nr:uncharacterized protein LOC113305863 [Papaver somniferum]
MLIGDKKIEITCVYGAVEADEKIAQWSYISDLAKQIQKPWEQIGDLNIILDPGEKKGGNNSISSSKAFVTQVIESLGLQDAGYEGSPFTWSNNRSGDANICERIDRALYLTSGFKFSITQSLTHPTLATIVAASWNLHSSNSPARSFASNLKYVSPDLAQWNSDVFGNIHKNIKTLNNKIENIHKSGNFSSKIDTLKNLQAELGKWYKIKNDNYHQLSRDNLFIEYDQNTVYSLFS